MIGSPLLLFPDAGEAYLRTLRASVLYADDVRVLTIPDRILAERMTEAFADVGPADSLLARRLAGYFRFVLTASPELETLRSEGLIRPLALNDKAQWREHIETRTQAGEQLRKLFDDKVEEAAWGIVMGRVSSAIDTAIPCLADIDTMMAIASYIEGDKRLDLHETVQQERLLQMLFTRYLLQITIIAEKAGWPMLSWSPEFQDAAWAVRSLFSRSADVKRSATSEMISCRVLELALPSADDLPLDELLAIRRKRTSELESLRVAVRELAAAIDLNASPAAVQTQVASLVQAGVDPAVDEVRRAVSSSRIDVLRKLGRSSPSVVAAVVTTSASVALGAPLDLAAAVGAMGGVAGILLDGDLEKRKILCASQWSFLFRLQAASAARRRRAKKPHRSDGV